MSRFVILAVACSVLSAAQSSHEYITTTASPIDRAKRQNDDNSDPFVSAEEARENQRILQGNRHNGFGDRSDGDEDNSNSEEGFDRRPHFIPPPSFSGTGPVLVQIPMAMQPTPIPPPEPIVLPVVAQEGDGLDVQQIPQPLPQDRAENGDFRRPSGPSGPSGHSGPSRPTLPATTTTTTTTPSPRSSSGFFPSSTLTCSSVRCPSGMACRMENTRHSRQQEPQCFFIGSNTPSSCNQVRCTTGFECEMQQSSSCSRLPCPPTPVCVQTPVSTPSLIVSCDSVRCSAGTVCRIQAVDHCTFSPCAMQAVCISPCASVSCPSNTQCKVDERTLATSCVPNVPAHSSVSCQGVSCGHRERCMLVKNCTWSRECRDEAKCVRF